jgi:hypothetical protein
MLCMCAQPSNYFELFVKGRAARLVVPIPAARISDGGAELQCRVQSAECRVPDQTTDGISSAVEGISVIKPLQVCLLPHAHAHMDMDKDLRLDTGGGVIL